MSYMSNVYYVDLYTFPFPDRFSYSNIVFKPIRFPTTISKGDNIQLYGHQIGEVESVHHYFPKSVFTDLENSSAFTDLNGDSVKNINLHNGPITHLDIYGENVLCKDVLIDLILETRMPKSQEERDLLRSIAFLYR